MPTLRVEMFAGRTVEQKRALARELTEATVRALGVPASAVEVLFYDIERSDWAVGGTLCSDPPAAPPRSRPEAVSRSAIVLPDAGVAPFVALLQSAQGLAAAEDRRVRPCGADRGRGRAGAARRQACACCFNKAGRGGVSDNAAARAPCRRPASRSPMRRTSCRWCTKNRWSSTTRARW